MPGYSPWCGTVTCAVANQVYSLLDLIQALPVADQPDLNFSIGFQFATLQANENGAAGVVYYIGNKNLSSSKKGVVLFATQVYPVPTVGRNVIRIDHIYLMTTGTGEIFNVTLIQ